MLRALPSNPYEIQRPVLVTQRYRPKDDALGGALRISALVFDQVAGASLPLYFAWAGTRSPVTNVPAAVCDALDGR